jgi:hypothetical protein
LSAFFLYLVMVFGTLAQRPYAYIVAHAIKAETLPELDSIQHLLWVLALAAIINGLLFRFVLPQLDTLPTPAARLLGAVAGGWLVGGLLTPFTS